MSYLVQKVDSVVGRRDILGTTLLNTSSEFHRDVVKTTLTLDNTPVAASRNSLHRGSTLAPPSENWYGWMGMFRLRRVSSTDDSSTDRPDQDDADHGRDHGEYSVYCEQITADKTSFMYKLFSSTIKEEAFLACESLKRTLQHFADTKIPIDLFESLVLPQPKTLSELPETILDYLKSHQNCKATDDCSKLVNLNISQSPLTYHACVMDEVEVLKYLIKRGANLFFEEPHTGNGLLHTAAKYSHSCLVALLDSFKETCSENQFLQLINKINHYNFDSKRLKNPQKMQTISIGLAEMNILGLAPYRISPEPSRKKCIRSGVTPLMIAAGEDSIKSVGILLAFGADPNESDPLSGTTALHVAALSGNISLIQMLVTFGADIESENDDGDSPLDFAKTASSKSSEKCVEIMNNISILRKQSDNVWGNGVAPKSSNKGMYLLSIDGGGTRSLIPSYVLGFVEKRMNSISQKTNIQISQYFNWLSGTSAGSFIVLGMIYNSITPSRVLTSIIADRDKLFSGNRIYKEEGLEQFIKGIVGDEKYVDEINDPKVIVPTTLSDRNPPQSVLITNYQQDSNDGRRWKIHEAVHASAAAPTYFPAFEKKYVDGGLMAPNPTLVTMTEALNHSNNQSIGMVLSLGTGVPPTTEVNLLEVIYPRISSFVSDIRHDLKYVHQLIDLLTANITNLGHSVSHAEAWCKSLGATFYRLSPNLTTMHDLDSKDDSALADIFYETYIYCLQNAQLLENLACELLDNGPQHSL